MAATFMALGTNGWMPSERRETCCFAVTRGGGLVILDLGTGARRIGHPELEAAIKQAGNFHILLSGFGLDHTAGLLYLPKIFRGRKVTICAPGREITGEPAEDILGRLAKPPLFQMPLEEFPLDLEIRELAAGRNSFPGFDVFARPLGGPANSVALRIDDLLAYVVDTPCREDTADFARGAVMLLHECGLDENGYNEAIEKGDTAALTSRSWVSGVTDIAENADVELLAMAHLNPEYREGRLRRMEIFARKRFHYSLILHDFQQFTLDE